MWLITKPSLAKGVKIKVKVEDHFGGKKISADLGELAEWVCIANHETNILPPAGFGMIASAGGVPHVHTEHGIQVLDDGQWVVVMRDFPMILTENEVEEMFIKPKQIYGPNVELKRAWMLNKV